MTLESFKLLSFCSSLGLLVAMPLAAQEEFQLPGKPPPVEEPTVDANPGAIAPPNPQIETADVPIPDRVRIMNALGVHDEPTNPYRQNTLKGDRPVFDDWYVNLGMIYDKFYEPRSVPVPQDSIANNNDANPYGRPRQYLVSQTVIPSISFIKGDTTFQPPDFELRIVGAANSSHLHVQEAGLVYNYPDNYQDRVRNTYFIGLQEAFVDYHLQNVSDNYDFDAIRVGIQPINADFRGFLFQDQQLGVRLFGNRASNRFQYNLAAFRRIQKDTNSGLNDLAEPLRRDSVALANLFVQDFPVHGFTTMVNTVVNWNDEQHVVVDDSGATVDYPRDSNNNIISPAPIGLQAPRKYNVTYYGLHGDGHLGFLNLMYSYYWAHGEDSVNELSLDNDQHYKARIDAHFFAAEPSIDFDWIRLRGSFLYASGSKNPGGRSESGFDAIRENPQFAGSDTSYWDRQSIPFTAANASGVILTGRNGLLPSLRTSLDQGQSNFNNPGLILIGAGLDFDILPEMRLSFNANHLAFDDTVSLDRIAQVHFQNNIGWDLSTAATIRPFDTQNVILRGSLAVLAPSDSFQTFLVGSDDGVKYYFSALMNLILTY